MTCRLIYRIDSASSECPLFSISLRQYFGCLSKVPISHQKSHPVNARRLFVVGSFSKEERKKIFTVSTLPLRKHYSARAPDFSSPSYLKPISTDFTALIATKAARRFNFQRKTKKERPLGGEVFWMFMHYCFMCYCIWYSNVSIFYYLSGLIYFRILWQVRIFIFVAEIDSCLFASDPFYGKFKLCI